MFINAICFMIGFVVGASAMWLFGLYLYLKENDTSTPEHNA